MSQPWPRPSTRLRSLGLVIVLVFGIASGSWAQVPSGFNPNPGSGPAPEPARAPTWIDRTRESQPEWLAEVLEILGGGQLAPGRGWFESGISRTRFDWPSVRDRLDRDQNGSISRQEFSGPPADFLRLDRDRSGLLTAVDFEFPENGRARSRSRMVMSFADKNGDGRVDREEYKRMFFLANRDNLTRLRYFADAVDAVSEQHEESERSRIPFLAISDFRETVDLAARQKGLEIIPDPDGDIDVTTPSRLWKSLIRHEIGSPRVGPRPGESAPDFILVSVDGKNRFGLSSLVGPRPIVLIFGSLTSETFRGESGSLEKLYRRYGQRARFLMVYLRESHPADGWALKANAKARIELDQPKNEAQRLAAAQEARKKLDLGFPMVVDSMDDRVGILYSGMPDRLYLLDRQGKVAYQGGRSPFGFKPDELEQSLVLLLQADPH